MSLATRISLVTGLAVALVGAVGGIALYLAMRESLQTEMNESLRARLTWLEAALEVDSDDVDFEPPKQPTDAAANWRVALQDGRILWSSGNEPETADDVVLTKRLDFGDSSRPLAVPGDVEVKLPEDEEEDDEDDEEEDWENQENSTKYKWPGKQKKLRLTLTTWASGTAMRSDLTRLALVLSTVGPAILVLLIASISLLVRWQLRPLHAMAGEAAGIGPANLAARISTNNSCAEYAALSGALNTMIARLAEGLERERRFSSAAAHEFRTPLAQMRTGLEVMLRRPRPTGEYQASAMDQLKDVVRLEKLVTGLLWISKASRGQPAASSTVSLALVVEKVEAQCGAIFVSDREGAGKIRVQGDEELLISALSNVVDNANKYAPGRVPEMAMHLEGERVQVMVRDSGPGVNPPDRERIFEPLVRLDEARTIGGAKEGLGLGLSTARAILRALGGDLVCRDRTDGKSGAEFLVTLRLYVGSSRRESPAGN